MSNCFLNIIKYKYDQILLYIKLYFCVHVIHIWYFLIDILKNGFCSFKKIKNIYI